MYNTTLYDDFFLFFLDDIEIEPLLEPSSGTDGDSEPVYGNVGLCTIVPVKVEDLWDYVKANKINDAEGLKREYRVSVLECKRNETYIFGQNIGPLILNNLVLPFFPSWFLQGWLLAAKLRRNQKIKTKIAMET